MNNFIYPYQNDRAHSSHATLIDNQYLILFDTEYSENVTESFVLINVDANVIENHISFNDSKGLGNDIYKSYVIDSRGRIFFTTKTYLEGESRSSKICYLNIFLDESSENKNTGLYLIHEEAEEILYLTIDSDDQGRPLDPSRLTRRVLDDLLHYGRLQAEVDHADLRPREQAGLQRRLQGGPRPVPRRAGDSQP